MLGGLAGGDLVPPDVAALGPGGVLAGTTDDEDVLDGVEPGDGVVDGGLQRGGLAAAVAAVGGDDDLGVRVLIRAAMASAEKPPKTTECAAPMRAQASIATAASGIIGR
ncbi:hypothetical protein SBADM41S_08527 [Streptomyces badius]